MQLSLFSISYAGLWGQGALDLRQFIRRAGELGFDAVMLAGKRPHLSPLDADEEMIATLRGDLREAGVRCAAVAAYTDFAAAVAAEVPVLEMQIAYVEALCHVGGEIMQRQSLHRAGALAAAARVGLYGTKARGDKPFGQGIEVLRRSAESGEQTENGTVAGDAGAQPRSRVRDAQDLILHGRQVFSMFQ